MSAAPKSLEENVAWLKARLDADLLKLLEQSGPLTYDAAGIERLAAAAMTSLGEFFDTDWRDHVEITLEGDVVTITAKTELGARILGRLM